MAINMEKFCKIHYHDFIIHSGAHFHWRLRRSLLKHFTWTMDQQKSHLKWNQNLISRLSFMRERLMRFLPVRNVLLTKVRTKGICDDIVKWDFLHCENFFCSNLFASISFLWRSINKTMMRAFFYENKINLKRFSFHAVGKVKPYQKFDLSNLTNFLELFAISVS